MKAFAELYSALDRTTKTNEKVAALKRYLAAARPEDAAWAVSFLLGRRPKRLFESRKLAQWATEEAGVPEWLFSESYHAVGDFAETIALLLPPAATSSPLPLHYWVEERLLPMRSADDDTRRLWLVEAWREMDESQRFAWNKLLTGEFRVGVSQNLVVRAVAEASGIAPEAMAHRLMGEWQPTPEFWRQLISPDTRDTDASRPYPFCLAHPLEGEPEDLGEPAAWQIEWKWDGIRAQLIRRQWQTWLWSRGEELITDRFPELEALGALLPEGTVIDGEVLPWKDGAPLPFAQMQRRIGRKVLGAKILAEVPVVLVAYDLLEHNGADIREQPLEARRALLESAAPPAGAMVLSPVVRGAGWDELRVLRRAVAGAQGRGLHAQAAGFALPGRAQARRLVEVEDRSLLGGLRADLRAAGQRPARQPVHRLHFRRLGRGQAGPVRQSLLRTQRRRDPRSGRLGTAQYHRDLRAGSRSEAGTGIRTGLRRHSALAAASFGHRGPLSAHGALASRQKGRRGRQHRDDSRVSEARVNQLDPRNPRNSLKVGSILDQVDPPPDSVWEFASLRAAARV